jgi:hypothetical protein
MSAISTEQETFEKALVAEAKSIDGAPSAKKGCENLAAFLKGTFLEYTKKQADRVSDLCQYVIDLEVKLDAVKSSEVKHQEKLTELEKHREIQVVKNARQDMGAKMEAATQKIKILDIDFDKNTDDRKTMMDAAKYRLVAKVKTADQARYNELVKKAVVQILAKKTTKRKRRVDGEEIWTAPIVLEMKEKEERWEMENLLRRSNIHPTFHWPKEFLGPMKTMREELKERVNEETHYVRIRPVQIDGKWKVCADTKPKEGEARFKRTATWDVPPADEDTQKLVPDWHKPSWAEVVRGGRRPSARIPSVRVDSDGQEMDH